MALLFSQPTGYLIMYYYGELPQISLHSLAYVRIVDRRLRKTSLMPSLDPHQEKNVQPREGFILWHCLVPR